MSISSEIERIQGNIEDAYDACESKGATMPQTQDSANLADCIETIDTASIETLTITPTTSQQTITAPSGTDGYSPITVNAVTSSIDSDIKASNIKSGVNILGVTGTVTELKGETRSVSLTDKSGQTFTPSSSKNGITSITVTPNNKTLSITPSTSSQSKAVPSGYSGYGTVSVSAVTSAIDSNITANNIKNGVSILGVAGTYTPDLYIGKQITQNGTYTAINDNKDGYYSVVVNVAGGNSGVTGIRYTDNAISTEPALDTELNISTPLNNHNVNSTSYIYVDADSMGTLSNVYTVSTSINANASAILVAKVYASNNQITGVDMYKSGYDAEYDSNSVGQTEGMSYSNGTLTILANYLNDVIGSTYYLADASLTLNSGSFSGQVSTSQGNQNLNISLQNSWSSGTYTDYFSIQNNGSIQTAWDSNSADFSISYTSLGSGSIDANSISITIYTTGWEYTPSGSGSGSGGNNQGGGSRPALTVDNTNGNITINADYLNDIDPNRTVINDVVMSLNEQWGQVYYTGTITFSDNTTSNIQIWVNTNGTSTITVTYNNGILSNSSGTNIFTYTTNATNGVVDCSSITTQVLYPANWVS